jgi:GTPase
MYDEDLAKFEWIIVANKMDAEGAEENLKHFKQRFPKQLIIPISAEQEQNLEELKSYLEEKVAYKLKPEERG